MSNKICNYIIVLLYFYQKELISLIKLTKEYDIFDIISAQQNNQLIVEYIYFY